MKDSELDRRFLSIVFYEGPWERLSGLAYGLRRDGSLRWNIPVDPRGWRRFLGVLGDWADRRDHPWHDKYLARGVKPHRRWKRRVPGEDHEA